jgi:hypothetical protein
MRHLVPMLGLWAGAVLAHDGHGAPPGPHLHASDGLGFVVLALVIAWWIARRTGR